MQYPLISEYVRAIQDASNNLDQLAHLVPVLDDHGEPYRSSGAFAVVFKMKDEQTGKCYALKCFTEEQEGRSEAYRKIADELECVDSSYLTSVKYLEKEIFVDSSCEEDEFPVLLMDWIDGETMEKYIIDNCQDSYAMTALYQSFCRLVSWLHSQSFAHGDIKPDNIMVRSDGSMTLVDYDGMFVPAMKGQKSPTIGTKDFSHPLRNIEDFDETIDDFALASMILSLYAMSKDLSLYDRYGSCGRLLFTNSDYLSPKDSLLMANLLDSFNTTFNHSAYLLFVRSCVSVDYKEVLEKFYYVLRLWWGMEIPRYWELCTDDFIIDEFGVKYSTNGKILLNAPDDLVSYKIKEGTFFIASEAFSCNLNLKKINFPDSLCVIGNSSFAVCSELEHLIIPDGVQIIGKKAFVGCSKLRDVYFPEGLLIISDAAFLDCESLRQINVPKSLMSIGNEAFSGCLELENIFFSKGLLYVGNEAFFSCRNLSKICMPNSVVEIGEEAFALCELNEISISGETIFIGKGVFKEDFCDNENLQNKLEYLFGEEIFL